MILGNHVTVSCLVSAVSMDGALDIRWRINGRLVKPLANSRIQTTELNRDSYDPSLYTSNLVINGIKKIDTGIKIYTLSRWSLAIHVFIDKVIWGSYEVVHKYQVVKRFMFSQCFDVEFSQLIFAGLYCFLLSVYDRMTSLYQRKTCLGDSL